MYVVDPKMAKRLAEIDKLLCTRVEIIDHSEGGEGRDYVKYALMYITFSLQDDGRTLKIFLDRA